MKKFFYTCLFLFSVSSFANTSVPTGPCPDALPTDHPSFCASFPAAATCYCRAQAPSPGMCANMQVITKQIMGMGINAACFIQHFVTFQACVDNWVCYIHGGFDTSGRVCSSTGRNCLS